MLERSENIYHIQIHPWLWVMMMFFTLFISTHQRMVKDVFKHSAIFTWGGTGFFFLAFVFVSVNFMRAVLFFPYAPSVIDFLNIVTPLHDLAFMFLFMMLLSALLTLFLWLFYLSLDSSIIIENLLVYKLKSQIFEIILTFVLITSINATQNVFHFAWIFLCLPLILSRTYMVFQLFKNLDFVRSYGYINFFYLCTFEILPYLMFVKLVFWG